MKSLFALALLVFSCAASYAQEITQQASPAQPIVASPIAGKPEEHDPFWQCIYSGPQPGSPERYATCNQPPYYLPSLSHPYAYGGGYYGYPGYGYYGYINPMLYSPEPCRHFPQNRACVMGKVKIDYKSTFALIRSALGALGLPESTGVDMYTMPVDPQTDEPTRKNPSLEGPVTKHNNWFNGAYRIEAGRYLIEFRVHDSGRVLFRSYITVRSEYMMNNDALVLQVAK